jgi:hypothetical protein
LNIVFTLRGEDGVSSTLSPMLREEEAFNMQRFTQAFGHVGEDALGKLAKTQKEQRKKQSQICKSQS